MYAFSKHFVYEKVVINGFINLVIITLMNVIVLKVIEINFNSGHAHLLTFDNTNLIL